LKDKPFWGEKIGDDLMAIPDYQSLMLPILRFLGDKKEHSFRDTLDALAKEFNLSERELKKLTPSGKQRIFDNRLIARVLPNDISDIGSIETFLHSPVSVGMIQFKDPTVGTYSQQFHMRHNVTQEKIMQYNHTGHSRQQVEHMLVKWRVAKVIEHPIIKTAVTDKPVCASYRTVLLDERISDGLLLDNHVNIVMSG